MNEICSELIKNLKLRFPKIGAEVFEELIFAVLDGHSESRDLNLLSQEKADEIWAIIEPLDPIKIYEWFCGLQMQKGGKFQNMLKDPMFEGKI